MCGERVARCSIEPTPMQSARCMNGPARLNVTGVISSLVSKSAQRPARSPNRIPNSFQFEEKNMSSPAPSMLDNLTLNITQEIRVRASLDATFAALLEQLGPYNEVGDDKPMPMVLEAWPGGRWFRDLGNGNGHYWGTVQAIKNPTLFVISAPLFISSHVHHPLP